MSAEAPAAQEVLGWMSEHGPRLRELVADEQARDPRLAPSDDPAIRAHLRFAAEALAATAGGDLAERLGAYADELPDWFDASDDLYDDHLATGAGAIALEEHLQYGTSPGTDPSLDAALHFRLRMGAWIRIFVVGLERCLGPAHDGVADQAMAVMGERSGDLARMIISLRTAAKAALRSAPGAGPDIEAEDEIAQIASVQGHVRLMIEAVTAALAT